MFFTTPKPGSMLDLGMAPEPHWPAAFAARFPALVAKLPRLALGLFPTPVQVVPALGQALGIRDLWIKRDDLSSAVYGGNKVRKLEFYFELAHRGGFREILTIGPAGSNHTAATGYYGRQQGFAVGAVAFPQPNAKYVRKNLLFDLANGVRLYPSLHQGTLPLTAMRAYAMRTLGGSRPYYIPPGGSSAPGVMGFMLAAFELADQIAAKQCPQPVRIYLPLGTGGTAAGLVLGFRLLGLDIQVCPVQVVPSPFAGPGWAAHHANQGLALMRRLYPEVAQLRFKSNDFANIADQLGAGYAHFTPESAAAVREIATAENIPLEGTYTGKALAGLIAHEKANKDGGPVMFWNTVNSRDLTAFTKGQDWHRLPRRLWRYFEEEYQALEEMPGSSRPNAARLP